MQSDAGQHSQELFFCSPVGMVFIPVAGSMRHSAEKLSTSVDTGNGANQLFQTKMVLDKE
jgi:hypothetical protein